MIDNNLTQVLQKDKKFLSIYVTAGYPNLNDTASIVKQLESQHVDFIELGMPFSDPMADGPVIQETSSIAIKNGMTLPIYFKQVQEIRSTSSIPLVFMGYYNQILCYGIEKFYLKCQECGIDGLIIPDLPMDEYEKEHLDLLAKYNLSMTFLITPQTSSQRLKRLDQLATGFIYVVSSNSITGSTENNSDKTINYLQKIGQTSTKSKKIVGFGIHDASTFKNATKHNDGAIIGSAFLKSLKSENLEKDINNFITILNHKS
jgi:tryptophan synthase alpha chain